MQPTTIEWTDFSSNPLKYRDAAGHIVWACVHASPGCIHCYSEQLAKRYGRGGRFDVPTTSTLTPFLDEKELHAMLTCQAASGKRCFPFDMTDLFGEWVPDELLHLVFTDVLERRRDVTWQLLTKRIDRAREYLTWRWTDRIVPRHIWIGTSVEDQLRADQRIPELLRTPAAARFISAEPLLGPVDLLASEQWIGPCEECGSTRGTPDCVCDGWPSLDWVIVGGESGPSARPMDLAWARSIVQQCQAASVPVFYKQGGSSNRCRHDSKGGCMECAPPDLRIREFPRAS